jgi:ketosteroid isomerase-like protein
MNEWESKAAIREVLGGYSGAAGRLDIDAFIAFFTEDAEIHGIAGLMGQPEPLKGQAQIAAFFGPSFARLDWLVQMNNITDVRLGSDGTSATTSTALVEMAKRKDADMLVLIARYDDELRLTGDGWRFARRTLTPFRFSQLPA